MYAFLMTLAATTAAPATAVDLSIEDRRALVYGLKARIGGAFVLTGLAGANGLCRTAATCVTVQTLVADGIIVDSGTIRTVDDLATKVRINGDATTAVVAIRGAKRLSRNEVQVFASVYDPGTKRWRGKTAVLHRQGTATLPKAGFFTSRIVSWQDSPDLDI